MKRLILTAVLFSLFSISLQAQLVQGNKKLKQALVLNMPLTRDDESPGTRGASVVWHPIQKKYYASFAGNSLFPMGVFDVMGKRLSPDTLKTQIDTRGLWYNPATNQINGNGYNDFGWFSYKLNGKGIPVSVNVFMEGMNQPTEQSVGAFHPGRKEIMFLNEGKVSLYSLQDATTDQFIEINWGRMKQDGKADTTTTETPANYNYATVIYTGMPNRELGFLNKDERQIELYDFLSGFLTTKLKLPDDAPVESAFNFAYANGIYWLFDIENRKWIGYK
jgi:hypothetical protein